MLQDLSKELNEWEMDVIGITETQMREKVELKSESYRMIGKGRSKWKKKGGGVGIMVRQGINVEVEEVDVGNCEMSEDIMAVNLEYKEKGKSGRMLLIVCYMTVEGRDARQDNERKYSIIERMIRGRMREEIIVMGDMNGHIGILGEDVNVNGQMLLEFTEENELENLNVTIAEGRVTWSRNESESAIDYMLVNENARKKVQCMWIDEEGRMDVASDHNMLVMEYECMRDERKEMKKSNRRKWKLKSARWNDFRDSLIGVDWSVDGGVDEINECVRENLTRVAEDKIGRVRNGSTRKPRKRWWNEEIERERKQRKECNRKCRWLRKKKENSEEDRVAYEEAWLEYKKKQKKVKWLISDKEGPNEDREGNSE